MAIEPGTRLGVYELLGPLGSGGMGEVYRARDTRLNRIVAIKVLGAAIHHRPDARERFKREALAIGALNDPNICTLYDVGHESDLGVDFLVMEYVEGETLAARLARGSLPVPQAITLARDIAKAVDHAHRAGVIHRDLKPSNIMLTKSGPKLLDFGLAKLRQADEPSNAGELPTRTVDLSGEGAVIGTLRYMAPELFKGGEANKKPDLKKSDLFSFGAVLYEMLTGEPAFKGVGNARIIAAILTEEPPPIHKLRPEVPQALDWITRTCLAKDPDERWQDAREIVRQLKLLDGTHDSPATPTPIGGRPRTRAPLLPAWAIVISVTLIAIPSVTMLMRRGPAPPPSPAALGRRVPHVVVLPCRPIDGMSVTDQAQCDGLAATLTAMLGRLTTQHALQVTPASEVHNRRIAGVDEARRQLGASLALEGSLMRADNRLRVTYALVDTGNRRQLDGITITSDASDLFGIQDRLITWATGALRVSTGKPATPGQSGTASRDAYTFALQGRGYLLERHRAGAIDVAIGLFKRALELDPRYAAAHAGLGEAYWHKYEATKDAGLVESARSSCRQALNVDPELAAAYICAGSIASGTGEHEQAIVLFERALQLEPASDEAYRLLARAEETLGRMDAALATYTQAVELRPHYWATHVWLGAFHRSRGNYTDAAREYERAVELTPDNAPVRGILAGMYTMLGRYDDALAEGQKSLELSPSFITYGVLGMTHYRMRRFDAAVAALEHAVSQLKDFRSVGNLARAHFWNGNRAQARELFAEAIRLGDQELAVNPRNAEVHVALADYNARLGNRDAALAHLGKARLDDPHFMLFAAMAYAQLGDVANGKIWLERARAAGLPPSEVSGWIDVDAVRK